MRIISHRTGIGPNDLFYCLVVVLVGSGPMDCGPGGQKLGFIFIRWGVAPVGSYPRTVRFVAPYLVLKPLQLTLPVGVLPLPIPQG